MTYRRRDPPDARPLRLAGRMHPYDVMAFHRAFARGTLEGACRRFGRQARSASWGDGQHDASTLVQIDQRAACR